MTNQTTSFLNQFETIRPLVLADVHEYTEPLGVFDSNLVRLEQLTTEIIRRNRSYDRACYCYSNGYCSSPESILENRERILSEAWKKRQAAAINEFTKLVGYLNCKCKETLVSMNQRMARLERKRADDEDFSVAEATELRKLKVVLSKYDFNDKRTFSFLKVFVNDENALEVAEEIMHAFGFSLQLRH